MSQKSFTLFSRFGVELEYMIVDAETLAVRPLADELIHEFSGSMEGDVSRGRFEWSNELMLHVIELKTGRPASSLGNLANGFSNEVQTIDEALAKKGLMLLPTGAHPWMNPDREARLWPHGNRDIYNKFNSIFDCRGHGWANLQSVHLNLPFSDEDEFVRLHDAIRLLLPIIPALSASSPILNGKPTGYLDSRLNVYSTNCSRIPSMTDGVVPQQVRSIDEYQKKILNRIYRQLKPHDPEGILQYEWANARGAIARFDRNAIEIRVIDIQECPAADLAILRLIVAALQHLTDRLKQDPSLMEKVKTPYLKKLLTSVIAKGGASPIRSAAYLEALGLDPHPTTVTEVWRSLLEQCFPKKAPWMPPIQLILEQGSLSTRILKATGDNPSKKKLKSVYRELASCLSRNEPFVP